MCRLLQVGTQVLQSFSEVPIPILYIIYATYVQDLNLKRTDSVLNSSKDVAILSEIRERLMSYSWSESGKMGWGKVKNCDKAK